MALEYRPLTGSPIRSPDGAISPRSPTEAASRTSYLYIEPTGRLPPVDIPSDVWDLDVEDELVLPLPQ